MKNPLILLIALCTLSFGTFAADKSNRELKGDKYFFLYSFAKAAKTYTKVEQLTDEGQRRLAESYKNLNQFASAEAVYADLVTLPAALPEDYYNYAMVLKSNGKYKESNVWMTKFSAQQPNDLRAKDFVANSSQLEAYLQDDNEFMLHILDMNTKDIDFGTAYYNDQLVFTSSRATGGMIVRNDNWSGEPFMNLYVSELDGKQLKSPKKMDKSFTTKLHDGPVSFYNDGKSIAFTQNKHKDKSDDKIVELQLYFSTSIDGKWSAPEAFILNDKGYSVGHPCVSNDGKTMFFTSDMPGGFGGSDLYKISRDQNGNWGTPVNLGDKINTEGDEMFPYFEEKSGVLCFSSSGRFGLGGLDIFAAQLTSNGSAYNLGAPINTQADDFACIIDDTLATGYFSSNRLGGQGNSDIYAFDVLKKLKMDVRIEGIVTDKSDNLLAETRVLLTDEYENKLDSATTDSDGAYSFLVSQDRAYKLTGIKATYLDGYNYTNTDGAEYIIIANLLMLQEAVTEETPLDVVEEFGETPTEVKPNTESTDLAQILKINTAAIYFDFNASEIRPDATVELDKIVQYMNENPEVIIELSAFTDCRGVAEYNRILADKRAVSTVNYIKERITKPERISGKGYGENDSVNDCECEGSTISTCTDDEFQKNRRTEFLIVKK